MATRPGVCIDRVLPEDRMRPQRTMHVARVGKARGARRGGLGAGMAARAIAPIGTTWMNGTTLHVRFMAGTGNGSIKVRKV